MLDVVVKQSLLALAYHRLRPLLPLFISGIVVYVVETLFSRNSEQAEKELLMTCLTRGDVVLEIGGRTGNSTKTISRIVREGRVYSLEPNPFSFQILSFATRGIPNTRVFNLAASDKEGKDVMWFNFSGEGESSFLKGKATRSISVNLVTVDSFIDRVHERLFDAMVIDVEGHELHVLKGARRVLENVRVLIVEVHHYTGSGLQSRIEDYVSQYGLKLNKCIEEEPSRISVCLWERRVLQA